MTDTPSQKSDAPSVYESLSRLQKAMERLDFAWNQHIATQQNKKANLIQDVRKLLEDYHRTMTDISENFLKDKS